MLPKRNIIPVHEAPEAESSEQLIRSIVDVVAQVCAGRIERVAKDEKAPLDIVPAKPAETTSKHMVSAAAVAGGVIAALASSNKKTSLTAKLLRAGTGAAVGAVIGSAFSWFSGRSS